MVLMRRCVVDTQSRACGGGPLPKKFPASTFFSVKKSRVNPYHIRTPAMEISQQRPLSLSRSLLLILALNLILPTQALYFYLDGASASPKCFYEELPKDTLVVGEPPTPASFPTDIANEPHS